MPFSFFLSSFFLSCLLLILPSCLSYGTDFRTLNDTFVSEFPATAVADSSLRHASGEGPFQQQSEKHGFLFESGLISSPTTFSLDIPVGVKGVKTHPHPSFFLSPGISVGYRHADAIDALKLMYFGAFDFYFGALESGPVYSRLQNPVIVYEHRHRMQKGAWRGWTGRLGVLHESNGMFIEDREAFEGMQKVLPPGYDAQDFASMGWNAWLGEVQNELRSGDYRWRTYLGIKLYTQMDGFWRFHQLEDTSLFYSNMPAYSTETRPHIWDYDGVIAMVTLEVPGDFVLLRLWPLQYFPWSHAWFSFGMQTGGLQAGSLANMLGHCSYHIALKGRWYQLPWIGFLKYAYGYTDPIAYYPLPAHHFSMGIEFANFSYGK